MNCQNCNASIEPGWQHCPSCGGRITTEEEASVVSDTAAHIEESGDAPSDAKPSSGNRINAKDSVIKYEDHSEKHYHEAAVSEKDKLHDCPLCGAVALATETFNCRSCGKRCCEKRCYNEEHRCCVDCAREMEDLGWDEETRRRAVLSMADGRKVFLISKEKVGFGKSKKAKNPDVDIPLRVLPSRSQSQDPENWEKSLMISNYHGCFALRGGALYVRDESRNGIHQLAEARIVPGAGGSMSDLGSMSEDISGKSEGDRVPQATPIAKNSWVRLPDVGSLVLGKDLLHLRTRTYRNRGKIGALKVERRGNCPHHQYLMVVGKATMGGSSGDPIFIKGAKKTSEVSYIEWKKGEYFLTSGDEDGEVTLDGKPLAPGESSSLAPGSEIAIEGEAIRFDVASDDDFVNV